MFTLAVINQKGGVGKTTTAVTLGHGFALRGKRTLLVDLDAQGNVADTLGLAKTNGLYRLLVENAGRRAVKPSGRERLDVILSDKSTVEAKAILISKPFREQILKDVLAKLSGYDWCILDVAPGIDVLQLSALVAASHYIIPVNLHHLAVVGAGDLLATASVQAEALSAQFLGVLPTFLDRRYKETREQLGWLAEQFGRLVWEPVPVDSKAVEAPSFGQTLWEYAPDARALRGIKIKGRMVGGYEQVLDRLLREVGDA
jgi:chromosome partitioning protein